MTEALSKEKSERRSSGTDSANKCLSSNSLPTELFSVTSITLCFVYAACFIVLCDIQVTIVYSPKTTCFTNKCLFPVCYFL